jgi:hypothetical protein
MLVTVVEYKDAKIGNLSNGFTGEHVRLENLLTHDFKCRFNMESIVSLINPSLSEFVDGLERLRRMSRPTGFTFIYICAHVGTVSGRPAGYMCFRDTDWKNTEMAKRSTLSSSRLCTLINAVPGTRKTIALSIAHDAPQSRRFASNLKLYPPKNFYCDLADECKCTVLGACNIGTPVREQLMHTPPLPLRERENAVLKAIRLAKGSQKAAQRALASRAGGRDDKIGPASGPGPGPGLGPSGSSSEEESESDEGETPEQQRAVTARGPVRYRRYRHHDFCPAVVTQQLAAMKKVG